MEPILVKKYENRRLYSSTEKRYVTLTEIASWVVAGKKVQVIDVTNENDITAEVLTQILLENGRAKHLPVELLENMIRFNEFALKNFWSPILDQSMEMMKKWNPFLSWPNANKEDKGNTKV